MLILFRDVFVINFSDPLPRFLVQWAETSAHIFHLNTGTVIGILPGRIDSGGEGIRMTSWKVRLPFARIQIKMRALSTRTRSCGCIFLKKEIAFLPILTRLRPDRVTYAARVTGDYWRAILWLPNQSFWSFSVLPFLLERCVLMKRRYNSVAPW